MRTEWAFLAGLGVGTVATLMLAPQSGKHTQELLADKLRGGLDQVTSAGKKVRAQVKDLATTGEASAEKSDEDRAGEVVQRKTSLAEEARQERQYPGQSSRQIVVQEPGNNPRGNLL